MLPTELWHSTRPVAEDSRPLKIIRPPRLSLGLLLTGIENLRNYAGLLYSLTALRLSVRYKQSVLGWLWAVLQPLALMAIYTLVFTRVATVSTGPIPYPVFAFSGLLPWVFFSSAVSNATYSIVGHSYLVSRMYFPREIIPLSYVAAAFADFLIASLILGAFMIYYRTGLTFTALLAVPVMGLLILFATGVALLLATLQVRFRDVGVAIPMVLQVWMFVTPVLYPISAVPGRFRTLYWLNPVSGMIDSFRRVVLQGALPESSILLYSGFFSIAFFGMAYIVFKTLDANMADVI